MLSEGCAGCFNLEGKPFWTAEHTENGVCPIFDCAVNQRNFRHCGECSELPCPTFIELRDPSMPEDEYQEGLKKRITCLKENI